MGGGGHVVYECCSHCSTVCEGLSACLLLHGQVSRALFGGVVIVGTCSI